MGGLADIQYLSFQVDFYKTLKLTEQQKKKERREKRTPQKNPHFLFLKEINSH